jgi:hypothetical protein
MRKKTGLMIMAAFTLFGIHVWAQGNLFEIETGTESRTTKESPATISGDGPVADSPAGYRAVGSNTAPAAVKPDKPSGKSVSIGSEKIKSWFAEAAKYSTDWNFPEVTNKYGHRITREDYLRAIIWIESRGTHANSKGSVTKSCAGALGFMQLMPNTARGLKINPQDPSQNLKGGAKYLKEIFNSGSVGRKSGEEKLIMGACAYNLGPFSKSMKMSWEALKKAKVPIETRSYGLKLKMCLGLELTDDEKVLVKKWLVTKGHTLESLVEENYTNTMGIAR